MTSEGQTVEPFEASHKHKNFDGKTKIPNFKKDDGWVEEPSGSLKITFEVICRK